MSKQHKCTKCGERKPVDEFPRNKSKAGGREKRCKGCHRGAQAIRDEAARDARVVADERLIRETKERVARIGDEYAALALGDFDADDGSELTRAERAFNANADDEYDVGVANVKRDRKLSAQASREKKQEFNRSMGENAEALKIAASRSARGLGSVLENMPGSAGSYIAKLAEQERRFGNRRIARTVSLAQAQEALALQNFKIVAEQILPGRVVATGFATRAASVPAKRTVCCLLSDLHLGAELSALDEPIPFGAVQEARRLEAVLRQLVEYKPQYRKNSRAMILLNGDLIEGQLMHQIGAGAPLTEQKAIFWHLLSRFVAEVARAYPEVHVECQPGNHGRDKVRHPGRATWRKWDGHEWEMYYALRQMCSGLKNTTWSLPFRAVSAIDLHGSTLGLTHADTEVKIGHPDGAAKTNARELAAINSSRIFGVEFDAWAFGHYHTPRYHPGMPIRVIYNGALIPPNGHARASGYIGEPCGQFIWEAVEGHPIGDVRFIEVGTAEDNDERLGKILTPFRFELAA